MSQLESPELRPFTHAVDSARSERWPHVTAGGAGDLQRDRRVAQALGLPR